jgi:hypothetical protein
MGLGRVELFQELLNSTSVSSSTSGASSSSVIIAVGRVVVDLARGVPMD